MMSATLQLGTKFRYILEETLSGKASRDNILEETLSRKASRDKNTSYAKAITRNP